MDKNRVVMAVDVALAIYFFVLGGAWIILAAVCLLVLWYDAKKTGLR